MEELRNKLIKAIETLGMDHEETIKISQQLDVEIVKHMKGVQT